MSLPPLHERQTTTRFSDRVADYVRSRPSYPPDAIDAILDGLADPASLVAADIGAGTGIMTHLLAERGVRVHAVEPNADMRDAGKKWVGEQLVSEGSDRPSAARESSVTWHDATAEATGLADASVDLIVCAQSYHWFKPDVACAEFGRILKRPGKLALVWNDGDESTPVARRYYDLVRKASTEGTTAHQETARAPAVAPPFTDLCEAHHRHVHELDLDGLISRAMSASYVPKQGPAAERLIKGLGQMHGEHADARGIVEFLYDVWLWTCDL